MNQNMMVNPEAQHDEIEIDLMDLFRVIFRKLHLVLLVGVIVALLAFVGTKVFITPTYTSVTKVYVLTKQDANANVTYNDLQTGTQLINDYMELVKSRPVMEKVIAEQNLDMEPEQLAETVTVEAAQDTRIMKISVVNENPKKARDIANTVREAVGVQIMEIMDADSVNTVEEANLPKTPSAPSTTKNMVMGGMVGIVLALGVIVLIYIMDDTIKNPDDVERYLGLGVLSSIPLQEGAKKTKKKNGPETNKGPRSKKK